MSQRQNDGIFDEFEFMYRHKRELEDEKKRLEEEALHKASGNNR